MSKLKEDFINYCHNNGLPCSLINNDIKNPDITIKVAPVKTKKVFTQYEIDEMLRMNQDYTGNIVCSNKR